MSGPLVVLCGVIFSIKMRVAKFTINVAKIYIDNSRKFCTFMVLIG